jgi:hypothetical protein
MRRFMKSAVRRREGVQTVIVFSKQNHDFRYLNETNTQWRFLTIYKVTSASPRQCAISNHPPRDSRIPFPLKLEIWRVFNLFNRPMVLISKRFRVNF